MASILIAGDDPLIVETVRPVLVADGHELVGAADGDAALAEVAARPKNLDLLILDIMMPGKSGLKVAEELRENGGRPSLPIIFLAAKGEDRDREIGYHSGAMEYVTKPFKPEFPRNRVDPVPTHFPRSRPWANRA